MNMIERKYVLSQRRATTRTHDENPCASSMLLFLTFSRPLVINDLFTPPELN